MPSVSVLQKLAIAWAIFAILNTCFYIGNKHLGITRELKAGLNAAGRLAADGGYHLGRTVDRLLDRRICLGVTGFSGSGKSTFITSLVHQLRCFDQAALPGFSPALQGRILGVELHDLQSGINLVPYHESIEALSATPPDWPASTRNLSGAMLEIRLKPRASINPLKRRGYERLFVEIRDYPGEWLLDLPLLGMDYQAWCQDSLQLMQAEPRASIAGELLQKLQAIDPLADIDGEQAEQLYQEYVDYLRRCRAPGQSLCMIQPGRFLLPETEEQDYFLPLLACARMPADELKRAGSSSWFRLQQKRYDDYVRHKVKHFYEHYFAGIDRQIVIVDVLQYLSAGEAYLDDMRLGLARVLDSFHYGNNSLLTRLFSPRIDKVLFLASKIDQALPGDHEQIRSLLSALVFDAYRRATFDQVDVQAEAAAAVRATSVTQHRGKTMLQGQTRSKGAGLMAHPPIPGYIPGAAEWQMFANWQLPELLPPNGLQLQQGGPLPHIRMDTVIQHMLGDKC
jgi:predicted YcjX-like family ATPase